MARAIRALASDTRGSVTAEFAVTIPAVLLILGVVIGSVQIAAARVSLTALAGELARLEARGDTVLAEARLESFTGNPEMERSAASGVLCITVRGQRGGGVLSAFAATGYGCAAMTGGLDPQGDDGDDAHGHDGVHP